MAAESTTQSLFLNSYEARQLFHGVEFAIRSLRECKSAAVPNIMSPQEFIESETKLKELLHKMEKFALTFPEN